MGPGVDGDIVVNKQPLTVVMLMLEGRLPGQLHPHAVLQTLGDILNTGVNNRITGVFKGAG